MMLESKLFNMENGKSLATMIFDSFIISAMIAVALFSTEIPDIENCWLVVRVLLISFFSQLAFEKGIKPYTNGGESDV